MQVLVTGANQGIGFQIVKELAGLGHTVWLGSRNLAKGEEAARSLAGDVRPVQLDVTDAASIAAAVARVEKLDVLINNAAISHSGRAGQISMEEFIRTHRASVVSLDEVRTVWETYVFGVLAVTQAFLPLLRQSSAPRIVMVSSGAGSLTRNSDPTTEWRQGYGPTYAASKTAMNAITLSFVIDLEKEGIKVNAVSPGYTKTALNGFTGTETLEEGAAEAVRVALLGAEGPNGTFTHATMGALPW